MRHARYLLGKLPGKESGMGVGRAWESPQTTMQSDCCEGEGEGSFRLQCSISKADGGSLSLNRSGKSWYPSPIRGKPFLTELRWFHVLDGAYGKRGLYAEEVVHSERHLSPQHKGERPERHRFMAATPGTQKKMQPWHGAERPGWNRGRSDHQPRNTLREKRHGYNRLTAAIPQKMYTLEERVETTQCWELFPRPASLWK